MKPIIGVLQIFLGLNDYLEWHKTIYYWKSSSGLEVDFVIYGDSLHAFEIKHSKHITPKFLNGLKAFKKDYPMAKTFILYMGQETLYFDDIIAYPMEWALMNLPTILTQG